MRRVGSIAALVFTSACSGGGDQPEGVAHVAGAVGLALPATYPATLSVGLLGQPPVAGTTCSELAARSDYTVHADADFPADYETALVPPGDYYVVAVLVDDASSGRALEGDAEVTVRPDGILEQQGVTTTSIDVTLMGDIAYACP